MYVHVHSLSEKYSFSNFPRFIRHMPFSAQFPRIFFEFQAGKEGMKYVFKTAYYSVSISASVQFLVLYEKLVLIHSELVKKLISTKF